MPSFTEFIVEHVHSYADISTLGPVLGGRAGETEVAVELWVSIP